MGKKIIWIPAWVLLFCSLACTEMKSQLIIGHRGAMGHETENTLASIRAALEIGVDMIEIDVFSLPGGEIVVFHDDEVDRLTDGTGATMSFDFDSLRALKVRGGHRIPTLQEILDEIDGKVRLNIELKGPGTAKPVDEVVRDYASRANWSLENFLISSFRWDELEAMRKANNTIPIAVLTGKDPMAAIPIAKELQAEAVNPNFSRLTPQAAMAIHEAGFKIYVWTVNRPRHINAMKRLAVDGIISDFPERLK